MDPIKRKTFKLTKQGENELIGYLYYTEEMYWRSRGWTLTETH